jgi:hypothetical protein
LLEIERGGAGLRLRVTPGLRTRIVALAPDVRLDDERDRPSSRAARNAEAPLVK